MKRLLGPLLCLSLLTACGAPPSSMETEYTGEELFLQEAYWYLQSDEKEIFSWENGVLEDYCAEEPRMVIGPEGEVDIQGMDLQRVRYERWRLFNGTIYGTTNLYFQEDGTFVGTDGSQFWEDQPEEQQDLYDGDISMWVFLSSPEVGVDDTLTVTCVLKKDRGAHRYLQRLWGCHGTGHLSKRPAEEQRARCLWKNIGLCPGACSGGDKDH